MTPVLVTVLFACTPPLVLRRESAPKPDALRLPEFCVGGAARAVDEVEFPWLARDAGGAPFAELEPPVGEAGRDWRGCDDSGELVEVAWFGPRAFVRTREPHPGRRLWIWTARGTDRVFQALEIDEARDIAVAMTWWPSGGVRLERSWLHGRLTLHRSYHVSGGLATEHTWQAGAPVGTWRALRPDGRLAARVRWSDGRVVEIENEWLGRRWVNAEPKSPWPDCRAGDPLDGLEGTARTTALGERLRTLGIVWRVLPHEKLWRHSLAKDFEGTDCESSPLFEAATDGRSVSRCIMTERPWGAYVVDGMGAHTEEMPISWYVPFRRLFFHFTFPGIATELSSLPELKTMVAPILTSTQALGAAALIHPPVHAALNRTSSSASHVGELSNGFIVRTSFERGDCASGIDPVTLFVSRDAESCVLDIEEEPFSVHLENAYGLETVRPLREAQGVGDAGDARSCGAPSNIRP